MDRLIRRQTPIWIFFAGVALVTESAGGADTRDPWRWPFAVESIWPVPIGADAKEVRSEGTARLDDGTSGGETCVTTAEAAKKAISASNEPIAKGPPNSANAWSPREGDFPAFRDLWKASHNGYKELAKKGQAEVVFFGDSITQGWIGDGKKVWAEFYEKRKAANFSIAGDGTPQILWRLQDGTLNGLKPKLVVLLIGTNNRWRGDATAANVSKGIEACVTEIRKQAPDTKVLVLGVFPVDEDPDSVNRKLFAETNAKVATLADGKQVFYLDLTQHFLQQNGRISKDIMPDFLHLSEAGYRIWATAMEPTIKKLLGEK